MALYQTGTGIGASVGIGTSNPQTIFDVRGKALIGDYGASGIYNSYATVHLRRSGVTPHLIFENIGVKTGAIACSSAGLFYGTDGSCDHVFRTAWSNSTDLSSSGTERFRIASNGVLTNYNNGASGSWNTWYLRGTSLWGDGITTYTGAYTTAGTLYQTIGDYCMFVNPHITASFGSTAYARFGRAGGVSTGTWWEFGTLTNGAVHIAREANDGLGTIYGKTDGTWGINRTDPGYTFDINGSFRVTSTSYLNTTVQLNFGGRAASALENQSSFMRWAHYELRFWNWDSSGDWMRFSGSSVRLGSGDAPGCRFDMSSGTMNVWTSARYAVGNVGTRDGGIVVGRTDADVTGAWTPAILGECADRWEMTVHDSGTRLTSLLYYDGPAPLTYYGRDIGWGTFQSQCQGSLRTAAAMYTSDWFRAWGNGGLYFESWGGGIYMDDSTWVKVYNSKAFLAYNSIASTQDVIAYYSDMRLKTNIKPIEDALEKLMNLSVFTYEPNELAISHGYKAGERNVGLSAQEVKEILPEVIRRAPFDVGDTNEVTGISESKTGEDYMTLLYDKMTPIIIKALQEESNARRELEARVEVLEKLLSKE